MDAAKEKATRGKHRVAELGVPMNASAGGFAGAFNAITEKVTRRFHPFTEAESWQHLASTLNS